MTARVPTDVATRKGIPLARGLLDYFPDALCAVAELSRIGNEQHNPGEPLHWAKEKSTDEADALMRHMIDRGMIDSDGVRHSTKVAWRALAMLQREIDATRTPEPYRPVAPAANCGDAACFYYPSPHDGVCLKAKAPTLDVGDGPKPMQRVCDSVTCPAYGRADGLCPSSHYDDEVPF